MPTRQLGTRKTKNGHEPQKGGKVEDLWRGRQKPHFPRAVTDRDDIVFVLDTNVLMTRPEALFGFEEHTILLPWKVLLELDKGKGVEGERGKNARRAIEYLVILIESVSRKNIKKGIPLIEPGSSGEHKLGKLFFGIPDAESLKNNLDPTLPDHKILLECLEYQESTRYGKKLVMVSKDKVMRILALLVGLLVEDYFDDAIDTTRLTPGMLELPYSFIEGQKKSPEEKEDRMFYTLSGSELKAVEINDVLVFPIEKGGSRKSIELQVVKKLVGGEVYARQMIDFRKKSIFGIFARNREQSIALNFLFDPLIKVVVLEGPAGSGKNFITLLSAYKQLLDNRYEIIMATRDAVPVGRETGFKPGTEHEKMLPWMQGMTDNVFQIQSLISPRQIASSKKKNQEQPVIGGLSQYLDLCELNSLRGSSNSRSFVIFDECQNSNREQQKLVLTRHGAGSKTVCLGNFRQMDLPLTERTSGFARVISLIRGVPWAAHVVLTEVERSDVAAFFEKYL